MKPSNSLLRTFLAISERLAPALLLLSMCAAGQERATLEEVVVTAQKREQKLEDVPTQVNVLSGMALATSNVTELNQVSTLVPGILITSDSTGRDNDIKIRGIGPDESTNVRPQIGFFYNDIPILTQLQGGHSVASDLDLWDLARVEVLKGPQSTIFGESVAGGAISFSTRRPSVGDGFNARISVTGGNFQLQQEHAAFGAPIGDKVAVRVSGFHSYTQDPNGVLNTWNDSRRGLSSEGYTAQLLFQPTDALKFIVEQNRRISRSANGSTDGFAVIAYGAPTIAAATAAGATLPPPNPWNRRIYDAYPFYEKLDDSLTSLHATWNINDRWTLTSITGYQGNYDAFGGTGPYGTYNASNAVEIGFWAKGVQRMRQITEELRADYAGPQLNSLFGVFYESKQSPLSRGDFGFVFPGFVFPLLNVYTLNQYDESVFTNNSFKFTDAWELVFGARYTHETSRGHADLLDGQGDFSGSPYADLAGVPLHILDDSAWGGSLKLLYHLNDHNSVYAGLDRGFLLGGANGLGQPNYSTEIAYNYEVGFKGEFLDNSLRFNTDIYYTKYNNYQVVAYNSAVLAFITQNADVTGKGLEVETEWLPIRQLTLHGDISYNDIYYTRYLGADCDNYQNGFGTCPNDPVAGAQNLTGYHLPQAPFWSANFYAQYGDSVGSTGLDWYLRGEYGFRSATDAHAVGLDGDPVERIAGYGLFNGSLGLHSEQGWQLVLWGKNLTNKNYYFNINRQPVGSTADYVATRIGFERTFGLTLNYSFH